MDSSSTLCIKLADASADPIVADRLTLRYWSSCVRELPAEAEVWDVSQLLLEGQPVQRVTVVAWLNLIHKIASGQVFEQQEPNPARSMTGLGQLLLFADAVGSNRGLLLAVDNQAAADVPEFACEGLMHPFSIASHVYFDGYRGIRAAGPGGGLTTIVAQDLTEDSTNSIRTQVAEQTECLLFLAYKLQLPCLQQLTHRFIKCCSSTILYNAQPLFTDSIVQAVLSERVLAEPTGAQRTQQALLFSYTSDVTSLSAGANMRQLLKPVPGTGPTAVPFTAEITEDFWLYSKGQRVNCSLDLGKSDLTMTNIEGSGSQQVPVKLVLGSRT